MKKLNWSTPETGQMCRLGKHEWSVARLIQLSSNLEVMLIPIQHLNVYHIYDRLSLREMVMHFDTAMMADLDCPIILDEDGELMDGRHRIMKVLMNGDRAIKAVRFDENPPPCSILEDMQ